MIPPDVMEHYAEAYGISTTMAQPKEYPDVLIKQVDVTPLLRLLDELPLGHPVAVDTETTGLHPHEGDRIRGISLAWQLGGDSHSFYVPVGYERHTDNLTELSVTLIFSRLKEREPFLIFHHGKFDLTFLRQLPTAEGASILFPWPDADRWWDTKIVAWLLDENMSNSLDGQAEYHFGELKISMTKLLKERGGWENLTPEDTAQYAARDAALTLRLYYRQQELVDEAGVRPAIQRELAINGVLARMERLGVLVDEDKIAELWKSDAERLAEVEAQLPFNPRSPKQVAAYLYDELGLSADTGEARPVERHGFGDDGRKTKNEGRSTAKASLERLPEHPMVTLLLEHRKLAKAVSAYYRPFTERLGLDGRLHATFWSTGTVTGRFSCSEPNLQTIPRADTLAGVRQVFIAEEGYELWEYDLKAAEKRVLAGLSGEQILYDILEDPDRDIHGELAARVFGDDFTGLQRRFAKNIGYGFDYGLTSVTTAAKYIAGEGAEEIAGQILKGLKAMYPNVVRLMNRSTRVAQRDGILPVAEDAWPGRFRHFKTKARGKRPAPFTALNFKIQGGIGELVKDVMIDAEPELGRAGARLCLQIHDALVLEVPTGLGLKVQEILQSSLDRHTPASFGMRQLFDANPWSAHD